MPKDTPEQQIHPIFKGKSGMSQEMEDAVWAEFFEILGLFNEEKVEPKKFVAAIKKLKSLTYREVP